MTLFQKLGGSARRREITALSVLALLTVTSIYSVMGRSRAGKLHLLNGLDVPVVVAVGGRTVAIEPLSQSVVVLPNGAYLAWASPRCGAAWPRSRRSVPTSPTWCARVPGSR